MYSVKTNWFCYSKKSGRIRAAYKRDYLHLNSDVDLDVGGPVVHSALVLGYVMLSLSCTG